MSFITSIFLGIILADFLSGVIHWIQDRYAKPSWPLVGGAVADAHEHHSNPGKMLKASFWKRNGATMILVGIIGAFVTLCGGLNLMTLTALCVGALANEIHATTHRRQSPWWITWLRIFGVIQMPAHHARHHHQRGEIKAYCVITSWLNPALDHLSLWTGFEVILFGFGVWPNEQKAEG